MYWILTAAILVYVILLALFTALPARKRHWSMAVVRLVIAIAAALIAVPFSKLVASQFSGQLYAWIEPLLGTELKSFMDAVPLAADSIQLIVTLFIAPLTFFLIFLVLRWLADLVVWIVERCVPKLRRKSRQNTAIAMPIGAVTGVLVAFISLIPLCGYVALATTAIDAIDGLSAMEAPDVKEEMSADGLSYERLSTESAEDDHVLEQVMGVAAEVSEDPMINIVNDLGGPLFAWMTSGSLQDGNRKIDFTLSEELPHLTESAAELIDAVALVQDDEITIEDKDALVGAIETLLASDWVAELASDSVGYIAETWLEGDSFLGIASPDMGPVLQPVMDVALTVLSTEDAETLRRDVSTVAVILTDLMSAGFLTEDPDYEELLLKLGESGLLNNLLTTLEANPHMAALSAELRAMSVRLVSSVLGDALKNTEAYDPMIDQLSFELTNVLEKTPEEREEVIKESVKVAFADYGVSVPEDVAVELSEQAIAELGEDGAIDSEELKDYFINHVDEGMDIAGDITEENGDIFEDIPDLGA